MCLLKVIKELFILLLHHAYCYNYFFCSNSCTLLHTLKHQFTLILKTLKNVLKNLPLHVSVHIYDHLQGAQEQCFVLLNSVDVRSLCSCTVCGRMSLSSVVCVCLEFLSWWNLVIESMTLWPDFTRTETLWLYDQISPGQELYDSMTRFHQNRNSMTLWPDFTRTGTLWLYDQISPGQELQAHAHNRR